MPLRVLRQLSDRIDPQVIAETSRSLGATACGGGRHDAHAVVPPELGFGTCRFVLVGAQVENLSAHVPRRLVVGGDHDDGRRVGEGGDRVVDVFARVQVELCGRLVDEEKSGSGGDRPGEHESLRLASRQAVEEVVRQRIETECLKEPECFGLGLLPCSARCEQREDNMVEDGAMGRSVRVLEDPGSPSLTSALDCSLGRGDPPGDEAEQSALPAS